MWGKKYDGADSHRETPYEGNRLVYCDYCHRSEDEVPLYLIGGENGFWICKGCDVGVP